MEQTGVTVYFYIPQKVTILDVSDVLQVFEEAKRLGFGYHFNFVGSQLVVESSSGLTISSLKDFRETNPSENDIIFISGSNTF